MMSASTSQLPNPMQHADLMLQLKDRQRMIAGLIGGGRFHYVDIPVHGNIGDLLIMHGTLAYFRNHGIWPAQIASAFEYSSAWVRDDETIVFHGGGNFGDLYAGTHRFRERIVAEKTGNRIVILPQTVHFASKAEQRRSSRVFRQHPDLHFCVRDRRSYEIALQFSEHVYLVPDMAHQLFPISARAGTRHGGGTLLVRRVDDEQGHAAGPLEQNAERITDWPELVGRRERRIEIYRKTARWLRRTATARALANSLSRSWAGYSGRLIAEAVELFASHDHIVSDRLHAHILACLMSKPNTVLDNCYGKNGAYLAAWTAESDLVRMHPQG